MVVKLPTDHLLSHLLLALLLHFLCVRVVVRLYDHKAIHLLTDYKLSRRVLQAYRLLIEHHSQVLQGQDSV